MMLMVTMLLMMIMMLMTRLGLLSLHWLRLLLSLHWLGSLLLLLLGLLLVAHSMCRFTVRRVSEEHLLPRVAAARRGGTAA